VRVTTLRGLTAQVDDRGLAVQPMNGVGQGHFVPQLAGARPLVERRLELHNARCKDLIAQLEVFVARITTTGTRFR
jgi:hypothetical protein